MIPIAVDVARETFVAGLRNMHAMQRHAKSMLNNAVARLENYPKVEERLRLHLTEKDQEMGRIQTILDDLGEDTSTFKDVMGSVSGHMGAMGAAMMDDEILKNSMTCFSLANMEIAGYESLITAGAAAGEIDAVRLLQQSLSQERAMAAWLAENMRGVTLTYMQLRSQGAQASH